MSKINKKQSRFGNASESLEFKVIDNANRCRNFHKPALVIVGSEHNQYSGIAVNHSQITKEQLEKTLDKRLLGKLQSLGELAKIRYIDGKKINYLGNCAEVHASNKVLYQCNTVDLAQLAFTRAYRLRTLQQIDYCQNCLDTFNIQN